MLTLRRRGRMLAMRALRDGRVVCGCCKGEVQWKKGGYVDLCDAVASIFLFSLFSFDLSPSSGCAVPSFPNFLCYFLVYVSSSCFLHCAS